MGRSLFTAVVLVLCMFVSEVCLVSMSKAPIPPRITSFSTGHKFACAVFDTMDLKCVGTFASWGYVIKVKTENGTIVIDSGNLGTSDDTLGENLPYVDIGTDVVIEKVSCGAWHICSKLASGDLKCLGKNPYGQVGVGTDLKAIGLINGYIGDNLPVVNLGTGLKAIDVTVGQAHTCVKVTGGLLKCFGSGDSGQTGLETTKPFGKDPSTMGDNLPFVNLGTGVQVASIYSGLSAHNCVILSAPVFAEHKIKCWGNNWYFQLGYGNTTDIGNKPGQMGDNLPFVDLGTESRVKQVALGFFHTCALLFNNILKCFGDNSFGELGLGTTSYKIYSTGDALPAVNTDADKTISLLNAGSSHTCVVYAGERVMKCFGWNAYGQLGQGDVIDRGRSRLTTLPLISAIKLGTKSLKISKISSGSFYSCVVFSNSSIKCFGDNYNGQCAVGPIHKIGVSPSDMGDNLKIAEYLYDANRT